VDIPLLEASVNEAIMEFPALCSVIQQSESGDLQQVLRANPDGAPRLEQCVSDQDSTDESLLTDSFWYREFDLANEAPFRCRLVKTSDGRAILGFVAHHIIFDSWSMNLFLERVVVFYRSALRAPRHEWAESCSGFSDWMSQRVKNEHNEIDGERLRRRSLVLSRELEPLVLPAPLQFNQTTLVRPVARVTRTVPSDTVRRVCEFAEREQTMPFAVWLAAWAAVVGRYGRLDRTVVGTPLAVRPDAESQRQLSYCLNTSVLHLNTSELVTFDALSRDVFVSLLEAFDDATVPFELAARTSGGAFTQEPRFFHAWFALKEDSDDPWGFDELVARRLDVEPTQAKFDLAMFVDLCTEGAKATIEYRRDLFEAEVMNGLLKHYSVILDEALAAPRGRIRDLNILDADDIATLDSLSVGPKPAIMKESLVTSFLQTAAEHPSRLALEMGEDSLTYGELRSLAATYARELLLRKVGPGTVVGLCVPRSFQMIALVLAVLWRGATYVALDPNYPAQRLYYIIQDSGLKTVFTLGSENLCVGASVSIEQIDGWKSTSNTQELPPVLDVDVAYITYTSGSTGHPKGIAMPMDRVRRLINWQLDYYPATLRGSRTLQFASLNFDVSFQEIFSTLLSGGTLILITEGQRSEIYDLMSLVQRYAVERLFIPAGALLEAVAAARGQGIVPYSLLTVIAGSEQLLVGDELKSFFEGLPRCRLFNEYGPSETHVATVYALPEDPATWAHWTPVGTPVGGAVVRVLDERQRQLPYGAVGEICIGGDRLAHGYVGKPAATAAVFIPDPFSPITGARMYRTGDLGRYRSPGMLDFLGRSDNQVKIRGFRVELDEVQSVLDRSPWVARSFVRIAEGTAGKSIVAYWVPAGSQATEELVREDLECLLPEYMQPSALIPVMKFELNANGKIDVAKLPRPDKARLKLGGQPDGDPVNDTEAHVAHIMGEIIGVQDFGVNEDFFRAGGNSLLANRLTWRLQREIGLEVRLSTLFSERTARKICRVVNFKTDSDH
jgi:amino acid adenylation domain